ncbi:low molecular weight protein-tyrosine-phosphatase [Lederbergia panacisoli]|uniref:low molecular weight protein-tyrosine-phosphatase n=1 Tax=Lederbergia panacisoli TaxID=1255251 RepID=UPI00214B4833|nr:low molecular weight protein-tyrosine-phosphatase [Lederbergia panacisoli]MCR2823010.1 low molecular weight phosphotyrosine protein phosphatase [Lederbergia panacisoli]
MVKVLFVCLGNICRSPMAEAIFRDMVEKYCLGGEILIDSAGTSSWHVGARPHKGTLRKLDEYRISSEGMFGRQFIKKDIEEFDYIIGMDEMNIRDIYDICGKPKHPKVMRLLDLTDKKADVPDPYYTGDFQETYDLLLDGCQRLLEKIKSEME